MAPPPALQVPLLNWAEETKYECLTSILFASAECEFTQHNATDIVLLEFFSINNSVLCVFHVFVCLWC